MSPSSINSIKRLFLAAAILTGSWTSIYADDWPQWRGLNRDAVSKERGLLKSWPAEGPQLKWKTEHLGEGYASVVVSNGLLHTIGNESGIIFAYGLAEQTGKLLWKTKIGESGRHALSTPTVDGEYLYALDPDGELSCINARSGDVRWHVDFISKFQGKLQSGRGYGESPLVDGNHLICTPGGDDALLVALEKSTGKLVWKTPAPVLGDKGRAGASFSSIVKTRVGKIDQYVQLVGRGLVGVACDDGRFLWGYNDISADIANIPTPIVRNNLVFAANGYNAGSVLLKLTSQDDNRTLATEIYRLQGNQFQNHHGGVIAIGEYIFGGHGSNNGLPTCLNLSTGEILWKRRGPGVGSAAVIYVDNRFIFRYQNGVVALIKADESGFIIQGKLQIPDAGGDSWSHPVVANGCLFLREQNVIYSHDIQDSDSPDAAISVPLANRFSDQMKVGLETLETDNFSLGSTGNEYDNSTSLIFYSHLYNDPIAQTVLTTPFVRLTPSANGSFNPAVISLLETAKCKFVIDLSGNEVNKHQLSQLKGMPLLTGLDLQLCTGVDGAVIEAIGNVSSLRCLRIGGTTISDTTIKGLSNLANLRSLDLEVCENISDDSMPIIAGFSRLRCLNLKKTAFEKLKITDKALSNLSSLEHLELLILYGNRLTDAGMSDLAKLTQLQFLDLSLVGITDKGVHALAPLKRLRSLSLLYNTGFSGPLLTDNCTTTISSFKGLKHLSLVGAKISTSSIAELGKLKELKYLEIQYTRVTPEGVERLQGILPDTRIRK
ncbi:MAG: PQQ-binding-like beta-propeller repeat protein [Planctomycetaceae bacterium]|jgi:outer membrane protein assembly factor BamB|nr:PQQ-binding-like beta-propeller repeat protein [Planctomycetaceae bacterium]